MFAEETPTTIEFEKLDTETKAEVWYSVSDHNASYLY
jgi:hypothetical protein